MPACTSLSRLVFAAGYETFKRFASDVTLTAGKTKDLSATTEIRRARATATAPGQALRLANIQTRFLVKADQMAAARALADSLLQANLSPSLDDARQLRGLAALTGHVHLAARLQRRAAPDYTFLTPTWEEVTVPLDLTDAALGLFAYASFGAPVDSISSLEQRVERLIPRVRAACAMFPCA